MTLNAGSRLGPYEIVARAGAGGMGEVYRARDTRLDRTVAVKVLPSPLVASAERRRRLEREARAISRLSHPNICTLHDIGHDDGIDYLVMEYLEGETLADRLRRGRLEWRQAIDLAVALAAALDAAHRQGIVHRDLKPANVMLTRTGPKVLDFGLAKLETPDPVSPDEETREPTLTRSRAVVGTLQYMSPEQLEGREADARADLWALGLIVHEAVFGERAFRATSEGEPPSLASDGVGAPQALDRLVRRCLARDREERWQSALDLGLALEWVRDAGADAEASSRPARVLTGERLLWTVVSLALAVALLAIALVPDRGAPEPPPVSFEVALPAGVEMFSSRISPDGRFLSFSGFDGEQTRIWVRPLDGLTARPIDGTEGARYWHFWSPDSRYIAFFADGELRRVGLDGGPPRTLTDAPGAGPVQSGSWSGDGTILFDVLERPGRDGLHRVSASGGEAVRLTVRDDEGTEIQPFLPSFLPDGRHFLCIALRMGGEDPFEPLGTYVVSLDTMTATKLLDTVSWATYAEPGYLLYVANGALLADAFDPGARRAAGDPFMVAAGVEMFSGVGAPNFAVANDGTLVYARRSSRTSRLEWRDRDGNVLERVGRPARYNDAHLSPDERTLAVAIFDPETSAGDLWLLDLERGVSTRATSEARSTHSLVWSPDGRRIAFAMPRGAPPFMHVYTLGGGEPDVLLPSTGTNQWPWDWLDDGRIVFGDRSPETNWDLWVLSPDGKETQPLLATQYVERDACVSPDGRWLAYVSDESGTDEIYVRDFPGLGEKHRVSTEGGARPEWGGDGSELYFVAGDGTLVAVPLSRGGFFRPGTAVTLFREDGLLDFDVTADGRRILVNVAEAGPGATAVVDRDWTAAAAGR